MASKQFFVFIIRSVFLGLVVALLILFLVPDLRKGTGFGTTWFAPTPQSAKRETYYPALSRSAPAVVNIYSVSIENNPNYYNRTRQRTSLGSGVIMTESGYILTCHHVIKDASSIFVALQDNRVAQAQIIGTDQITDLAVLKVNEDNLHVIPQLEEPDLRVGDVVMAIGNPYNLGQTITQGIVSRAGRTGLSNSYVDFIQTDAVLNQGNSGGALVDSNGYLVGITNANFQVRDERRGTYIVDGINFAVPYELAVRVMESIITNGKVTRGQLGFVGEELRGGPGIEVKAVSPNSPAAQAGLRPGDIIMSIDGIRLESASKALDMIAETAPGTVLELEVSRNARTMTIQVTVAELII
ncbi:trypsin-like peptidase domain-containing protein [Alteromonas gilva]|uniref:Trypsin-like peptidase domain-containing protein n=1 Tax=Alteromonas gilva TaxID=2987522 RepID=A0ABT5L2L2_9ALTE|nr:trypsin-like peptidase domain-containing protein [Alteromonas gilva]MDC8830077.1 trypsin-like peptidase domain-containing protein [Alteromonas gilva]